MTNRRTLKFSIFAAAVMALCLPMLAAAQGPWGRNGRYDDRGLRDYIHRLDRLAKDFEREVDRNLDRSRRDGTRREDKINNEARQFEMLPAISSQVSARGGIMIAAAMKHKGFYRKLASSKELGSAAEATAGLARSGPRFGVS